MPSTRVSAAIEILISRPSVVREAANDDPTLRTWVGLVGSGCNADLRPHNKGLKRKPQKKECVWHPWLSWLAHFFCPKVEQVIEWLVWRLRKIYSPQRQLESHVLEIIAQLWIDWRALDTNNWRPSCLLKCEWDPWIHHHLFHILSTLQTSQKTWVSSWPEYHKENVFDNWAIESPINILPKLRA